MSTSTSPLLTSPTSTPASPTQNPALLPLLLPYLLPFLRQSLRLLLLLPKKIFTTFIHLSHFAVITPLKYILEPFFAFSSILFSVTLGVPFGFLAWLLEALFPLYVFCGVACITGGLLGLGGRIICMRIVDSVNEERSRGKESAHYEETMKNQDLDPDARSAKRRRVEREARIKFKLSEDDDSFWYGFLSCHPHLGD